MEITELSDVYEYFKDELELYPFIMILGKYDQILGPSSLFSSIKLKGEVFIRNLLRDALNTKNKYVILDFGKFYSQVSKIEIEDKSARGGKQLYAIILLRHMDLPLIPILHFKRIEMTFHKIGNDKILCDSEEGFQKFFDTINDLYIKKQEILPLESFNLQIRSGINTIQGFCELILEHGESSSLTIEDVITYVEMMRDSCNEMTQAIEKQFSKEVNRS